MVGLQGSGKTTTAAKLVLAKKAGDRPLLIAADIAPRDRPAQGARQTARRRGTDTAPRKIVAEGLKRANKIEPPPHRRPPADSTSIRP